MTTLADITERQRALDPALSCIVQAPAGSGKTELLTQRFLVLLSNVRQPEEILAITFTKKSAAEMRARIIHSLKKASENPEPQNAHEKQTWILAKKVLEQDKLLSWNLLDNPSRLQIQTIDSLNASLTRQLPLLSCFGAPTEIADNPLALYREAVQEFLTHLEENVDWAIAIETLLLHMDNDLNKVEDLLVNMLAKRDQWLPYIALNANNPELRKTLESHLIKLNTDALFALQEIFPKDSAAELITLAKFAAQNLQYEDRTSPIVNCLSLENLPGIHIEDKKIWLGIAKLLLTEESEWRKSISKKQGFPAPSSAKTAQDKSLLTQIKQRLKELIDHLSQYELLRVELSELDLLPDHFYQESQWQTLDALHDVLRVVVAQLKLTFQQHGKTDYIENAQAALTALGTDEAPTDLTLALDYKIQHILIDEFQDTSNSQYRLLEKLIAGWQPGDGRSLFVVGDPMQSIYRFREAEVGLFIRARKKGIGTLTLTPLTLAVNFRSTQTVVNWVNQHFEKVFPDFEDIAGGAVSYSHSIAHDHLPHDHSAVILHPFLNTDESQQAAAIIQLIQKTKEQHPEEKIAILVRSRTHLKSIIPALKAANLAFRALDIDPLALRPVIQDLLSLTRALLHPADRIAWLAILRAPWCGLTLSDLLIIAGDKSKNILWQHLKSAEILNQVSPEGQARLTTLLPILERTLAERRRYPLRQWIEQTWLQLGGPACVEQENDLDDANAFFNLLEKLDQAYDLPSIESLTEAINKLYAAPSNQIDASLQIMTIHNAKGLEFDTVILPHLERKASRDEKQLLQWLERSSSDNKNALILAPIHAVGESTNLIYDYIKKQHDIKTAHENGRLLYVAATRAKKRLHIFFNLDTADTDNADIKKPSGNSLLQKLWPAIHQDITQHLTPASMAVLNNTNTPTATKKLKRLAPGWSNPYSLVAFNNISTFHQKKLGFLLPDNTQAYIGTVMHQILQNIAELGLHWWQEQPDDLIEHYITKQLIQLGILSSDIQPAISYVKKAIHNALHDERGQWILHNHTFAECEKPLTLIINGKPKPLVIDRTFVENNIRWIIDYKSTDFKGENLAGFLDAEKKLYETQLWEYHQALREFDLKPIRVGLYFPLIKAWKEWNFA